MSTNYSYDIYDSKENVPLAFGLDIDGAIDFLESLSYVSRDQYLAFHELKPNESIVIQEYKIVCI
jgi:hypothetical protein